MKGFTAEQYLKYIIETTNDLLQKLEKGEKPNSEKEFVYQLEKLGDKIDDLNFYFEF